MKPPFMVGLGLLPLLRACSRRAASLGVLPLVTAACSGTSFIYSDGHPPAVDAGQAPAFDGGSPEAGSDGMTSGSDGATSGSDAATSGSTLALFGGNDGTNDLTDVWTFANDQWKLVDTSIPQAFALGAVAPLGHRIVVVPPASSSASLPTLEWDGTSWTTFSGTAPPGRSSMALAPLNESILLFGGLGVSGDTWEFDGSSWSQEQAAVGPSERWGAAIVSLPGMTVLFGGKDGSDTTPRLADTWIWNGASWSEATPSTSPPGRSYPAAVASGGKMVVFGGGTTTTPLDDTWTFDGVTWSSVSVPTQRPPARTGAVMASDGTRVILFGGSDGSGNLFSDTWAFDGTTWTELPAQGPSARWFAAMVAVPAGFAVP